ncbi:MAG: SIS domain-containing protein [Deltaproteobacteria bacterium]|jgi:glucosamine--fructose-6-phosphate aminotransferase (isomerizing)|nr:SIS domain-containing protein [Deltaproteobacteria bacterium]
MALNKSANMTMPKNGGKPKNGGEPNNGGEPINDVKPFFINEIYEQPGSLAYTLGKYLGHNNQLKMNHPPLDDLRLSQIKNTYITACGTSYHAALTARYLIEELAQIPTVVEPASEFGRHHQLVDKTTLAVAVSQSGRSKDTLAALDLAKRRGAVTMAVVNEEKSPLKEAALGTLMTLAGKVRSQSSTKAFISQTLVLALLGLRLAQSRNLLSKEQWQQEIRDFSNIPERIRAALMNKELVSKVNEVAELLNNYSQAFILAKGHLVPMALEGALKLKEVAKIHAEAYLAGEFGHGPLALAGPYTPIIMFSFSDEQEANCMALAFELKARLAPFILITDEGPKKDQALASMADNCILLPTVPSRLRPMVAVIPLQLLAYQLGHIRGHDVDNPRGTLQHDILLYGQDSILGHKNINGLSVHR